MTTSKMIAGNKWGLGLLAMVVAFSTACTRKTSDEKSSLAIAIPSSMSSMKMGEGTLAAMSLSHVVINISGPEVLPTIVYHWDSHGPRGEKLAAPASHSPPEEVKFGSITVQLLAVYESEDGSSTDFYYGENTKTISESDKSVEIAISPIMSGSSEEGSISGRYLTGDNAGPTGEVEVRYAPEGKKPMKIMKATMINGWFNLFALKDVPFQYVMTDNGVETLLFGSSMTLNQFSSLAANSSGNLIEVKIPEHYETTGSGNARRKQGAESRIFGFFGSGVANKKVCYTSSSSGLQTYYYKNDYVSGATSANSEALLYRPGGTAGTDIIVRGHASSDGFGSCASGTGYVDYLKYEVALDSTYYRLPREIAPPFKQTSSGVGTLNLSSSPSYVDFEMLPGTSVIDNVKLYAAPQLFIDSNRSTGPGDAFLCDRFENAASESSVVKLNEISVSPGAHHMEFTVPSSISGLTGANAYGYVLCPFQGSKAWNGAKLYSYSSPSVSSSLAPDTFQVATHFSTVGVGQCHVGKILLTKTSLPSGQTVTNSLNRSFTVTYDGVPGDWGGTAPMFYSNSSCSAGVSSSTVAIASGSYEGLFYFKTFAPTANSNAKIKVNYTTSTDLNPTQALNPMTAVTAGAPVAMEVSHSIFAAAGSCTKVDAFLMDAAGVPASGSGSKTLVPYGVTVHSDPTCTAGPLSAISFAGSHTSSFYVKTLDTTQHSVAFSAGGVVSPATTLFVNPEMHAHHLSFSSAPTMTYGTCQIATVTLKNSANGTASVPSGKTMHINIKALNAIVYPNTTCSGITANSITVPSLGSSVSFSYVGLNTGNGTLSVISPNVELNNMASQTISFTVTMPGNSKWYMADTWNGTTWVDSVAGILNFTSASNMSTDIISDFGVVNNHLKTIPSTPSNISLLGAASSLDEISYIMLFKLKSSFSGYNEVFHLKDDTSASAAVMKLDSSALNLQLHLPGANLLSHSVIPAADQWVFVAINWSKAADQVQVSFNGQTLQAYSAIGLTSYNMEKILLGSTSSSTAPVTWGEILIFPSARTQSEVNAIYAATKAKYPTLNLSP